MLGGSRLEQTVYRKSSGTSGARPLRCPRNWDGLRSPISSSVSSWRMRRSLEGDSRCTSSVLSVVYGKSSGTSGARPLRCPRNWVGLRLAIFSSVSSWRMRCSIEGDSRRTSSVLSVVHGSRSGRDGDAGDLWRSRLRLS
jgi:hypothetical protein